MTSKSNVIVIVGGGAAGFFAAVTAARANPNNQVILLEKTNTLLAKVRISGGGRCNVTHACFDPKLLVKNYPRGEKALIGPFHRFQPKDTIEWFESRGVSLKTEEDGRMFPTTDNSQTIIDCLLKEAALTGVQIKLKQRIESVHLHQEGFLLECTESQKIICKCLILASGSSKDGYEIAKSLGHSIIPPVPSLFTFNVPNFPLIELSGVSVENAQIKIKDTTLQQSGPLLITHWGFSGPAALKLSAWGARYLHDANYETTVLINWLPEFSSSSLNAKLLELKQQNPTQTLMRHNLLPRQLWKHLIETSSIDPNKRLSDLPNKALTQFASRLQSDPYPVQGKTTYKQEFVTCGGIPLKEVNFKTMESSIQHNLFFAGEILDIDGITGGFNFQNAWTTGWLAGSSAAER